MESVWSQQYRSKVIRPLVLAAGPVFLADLAENLNTAVTIYCNNHVDDPDEYSTIWGQFIDHGSHVGEGFGWGGGSSDEAGECGIFAVCDLVVHGCRSVHGAMDLSYSVEGDGLCLRGPTREKALDCVGAAGGCFVGGSEYSHRLRDSGCGFGGGVSDVECELADWVVLGASAVS
jgi:hypothetical protein